MGPFESKTQLVQPNRTSNLSRIVDWMFGYDFFITYVRSDGERYPAELATRLLEAGFRVFLDTEEYELGDDLTVETARRIKMSQYLIVVAGKRTLESKWVAEEIEAFKANGRVPIIVVRKNTPLDMVVDGKLIKDEWLRVTETQENQPSEVVLAALKRSFLRRRQDSKRKRALLLVAGLGLFLVTGSIFWYWQAENERKLQQARAADSLATRAQLALDNLRYEDSVLLALAATAIREDGILTPLHRRTLTETASVFFAIPQKIGEPNVGSARSVAFSNDDNLAAIADNEGNVLIYDIARRDVLNTIATYDTYIGVLRTSPDGKFLISGSEEGVLRWWLWDDLKNLNDPKEFFSRDDHGRLISAAAFSYDGDRLATGGYDNMVRIWHLETGTLLKTLDNVGPPVVPRGGRENAITALDYSPVESLLAVASKDNTFRIIDPQSEEVLKLVDNFPFEEDRSGGWTDYVMALTFSSDGQAVSTGSVDGVLRHWRTHNSSEVAISVEFTEPRVNMHRLNRLLYLNGDKHIAASYDSGDLLIRRRDDGSITVRLQGTRWPTNDIALSPTGRYLASAALDGYVWFWDLSAISEPAMIDRLCDNLQERGTDLNRAAGLMEQEVSADVVPPKLCTPNHRGREFTPVLDLE